MICATGSICIPEQNITVNFCSDSEQIKFSTCSRTITMPPSICMKDEYEIFKSIMRAATDSTYNHV